MIASIEGDQMEELKRIQDEVGSPVLCFFNALRIWSISRPRKGLVPRTNWVHREHFVEDCPWLNTSILIMRLRSTFRPTSS